MKTKNQKHPQQQTTGQKPNSIYQTKSYNASNTFFSDSENYTLLQ